MEVIDYIIQESKKYRCETCGHSGYCGTRWDGGWCANWRERKEEYPMAYYRECPVCGGSLDPGEMCECQKSQQEPGAKSPAKEKQPPIRSAAGRKSK